MTLTRSQINAHFAEHGGQPSRALGQNFVAEPQTVRRIVRLADITAESRVIEIGAGLGSLTRAIAETGARCTAIEIDRYLIDALTANVADSPNVTVVHADAMTVDWDELAPPAEGPYVVIANLPYNVATPLLADLLDGVPQITRMLVMVQREVGERLAAVPRTKAYGAVSVKVAYWATARVVGTVPPAVFVPRPNVESALVRIDRRETPAVPNVDPEALFLLIRTGFAQRRKMLRRALADLVTPDVFTNAGIEPTVRAEDLDVFAWGKLAHAFCSVASIDARAASAGPQADRETP